MSDQDEFPFWLNEQMRKRSWSQSELARHAHLSQTVISQVLGGQHPGVRFCKAIAGAFGLPPEEVVKLAGILPRPPKWTPELDEWMALFEQLSDEDRSEMIELGRIKASRHGKREL